MFEFEKIFIYLEFIALKVVKHWTALTLYLTSTIYLELSLSKTHTDVV